MPIENLPVPDNPPGMDSADPVVVYLESSPSTRATGTEAKASSVAPTIEFTIADMGTEP